jgi:hypothetical protein
MLIISKFRIIFWNIITFMLNILAYFSIFFHINNNFPYKT